MLKRKTGQNQLQEKTKMNSLHKLYSETEDKVNSVLYNGKIIDSGNTRGFKSAVEFSNDANVQLESPGPNKIFLY